MNFDEYVNEQLPFINDLHKYYNSRDRLIIFEVGSCEGEDTIRLKKAFPNAIIYTFEPLPDNIRKIKANFKKYKISTKNLYQLALSDSDGMAEFFVSSGQPKDRPIEKSWDYGNKSSSLLPPKEHKKVLNWIKFRNKIEVPTQRLDSFCAQKNLNQIDFIYLDVQGAELMVLEGAGDMISKIGSIWMEVEAIELYKNQPLKSDVEKFMERNDFIKVKDTVGDISGDQLYINKSMFKVSLLAKLSRLVKIGD